MVMGKKRDDVIAYIREFIERGYEVHWYPESGAKLFKVYLPHLNRKRVNVEGDTKLINEIRLEVESGN